MCDSSTPQPKPKVDIYRKWAHHKIGTRIRISEKFIVHIDTDGKLDWEIDDDDVEQTPAEKQALRDAYSEIVVCESVALTGYSAEHQRQFLTILGEAYVHWIEGDPATVKKLVKEARKYIRERSEETSRRWYLTASMDSAGYFLFAGIVAWLTKDVVIGHVGQKVFYVGLAACSGAVGALFSVIVRSGKIKFKASAGWNLHVLEASSRITAGAISGVIAYLALTSDLLLGTLLNNPHRMELALLASLAAGAGERLATSIISRFEEGAQETKQDQRTANEEADPA